MPEGSDARTEQHTGPGDTPDAGQQAAGGKPGEEGKPATRRATKRKGTGRAAAPLTPTPLPR